MHLVKNINLCCRTCWLYRLHLLFYFLGILSEKVVFYLDQSKTPFFIYGIIQFGPKRGLVPVPLPKDALCQVWLNWPSGSGEEIFLISSMYYRYFAIISLWKRTWPFIWTNLNPLHPRMLCAKFGWNWPNGSGEYENVKSLQTDDRQSEKLPELEAQMS